MERWHDVDEAVAAFVVAHHNLADLHLRLNQPQESVDYLCAAHQRLLQASQQARLPQALRDAALRHSGRTYTQLLSFIAEYGQYPRTERLLDRQAPLASELAAQPDLPPTTQAYGIH
ncbi:hypothetical protein D3C79_699080 [compost metagenome]